MRKTPAARIDSRILSRAGQSMQVYSGKIRHGWPLIIRNIFTLLSRFNPMAPK